MIGDVFITYSSKDREKVSSIKKALEKNDITCWIAPDSMPTGSVYLEEIPKAIRNCKAVLLVLSDNAQASKWVIREVEVSIANEKKVIPFQIEKFDLNQNFKFILSGIPTIKAYSDYDAALNELIDIVKKLK